MVPNVPIDAEKKYKQAIKIQRIQLISEYMAPKIRLHFTRDCVLEESARYVKDVCAIFGRLIHTYTFNVINIKCFAVAHAPVLHTSSCEVRTHFMSYRLSTEFVDF